MGVPQTVSALGQSVVELALEAHHAIREVRLPDSVLVAIEVVTLLLQIAVLTPEGPVPGAAHAGNVRGPRIEIVVLGKRTALVETERLSFAVRVPELPQPLRELHTIGLPLKVAHETHLLGVVVANFENLLTRAASGVNQNRGKGDGEGLQLHG